MAYTTIDKSTDYFNTKLYTGTGASSQAQTGLVLNLILYGLNLEAVVKVMFLQI